MRYHTPEECDVLSLQAVLDDLRHAASSETPASSSLCARAARALDQAITAARSSDEAMSRLKRGVLAAVDTAAFNLNDLDHIRLQRLNNAILTVAKLAGAPESARLRRYR